MTLKEPTPARDNSIYKLELFVRSGQFHRIARWIVHHFGDMCGSFLKQSVK
jgi:hypothetical protein